MIPFFSETQRWHRFLSLALLAGSLVFAGVILVVWLTGLIEGEVIGILWGVWLLMTLIDGFLASIKLVTEVHADGIEVYFGPLHLPCRKNSWQEIEAIYPREYSPVAEYGGWGIRYGKLGSAYNIKGNQGNQIELKNDKKFLVGTQQPESFMQAISAADMGKLCTDS